MQVHKHTLKADFSSNSQDVFSPQRGSRSNVTKVLIVITDGQSNDRGNLAEAVNSAESKNIVRFAIGVSLRLLKIQIPIFVYRHTNIRTHK